MTDSGHFVYEGQLKGHRNWVTALACPQTNDSSLKVISASRDGTLVTWKGNDRNSKDGEYAVPDRRLESHTGFVQDVALSNNAEFAVSASWDRSLILWSLKTGEPTFRMNRPAGDTHAKFLGHTKDVLSCAFSPDNRQIVSGGRDSKLKVWNVRGECVFTFDRDSHTDWVSCVRFSPAVQSPLIISGGWDSLVKVWTLTDFRCQYTLQGHKGYVSSVTVSPDGSLCASAGRDGVAKLWDLSRGEHLYELECGEPINQITFSPNRYWLCAATENSIRVFDLENKEVVAELVPETQKKTVTPQCTSIAWSADGSTLYSGYTDNSIRVWGVRDK